MKTAVLSLLLVLFLPSYSFSEGTEVSAESLEHKNGVYTLEGKVTLAREDTTVSADNVIYDENSGAVEAEGNVLYEDPYVRIEAGRAEINLNEKIGVMYESYMFMKADGFHVHAPEMQKTGEDTYFLKKATATTCDSPFPAWCLAGTDVELKLKEKISAWHATFKAKGVPILYSPYARASLKTERSTGFLMPDVGYNSERGLFYSQPFFLVISENRDATFTLDLYTQSALGQGIEYRYIEQGGARGKFQLDHLRDYEINKDYYELSGRHRQNAVFLEVNAVNYREFFREYERYLEDSAIRYLDSRAEASVRLWENSRAYLTAQYVQDLKEGVNQDTVLQKLPEAGVFVAPLSLGRLVLSGNTSASNFERDEGEEGQRYTVGTTALHSVGQGIVFSQEFSAKEVFYMLNNEEENVDDETDNQVYMYEAALKGSFSRDYGSFKHTIEPSVSYSYVAHDGEEPVLLDSTEDITEGSIASLSVMNRLRNDNGKFMGLKLTQPYDLEADERPFQPTELSVYFIRPVALQVTASYDTYEGRAETVDSSVYFPFGSTSITAGQTYDYSSEVSTYSLDVTQRLTSRLEVQGGLSYDEEEEKDIEEVSLDIRYTSQCWGIEFSAVDDTDEFTFYVKLSLLGLGSYGTEVYTKEENGEN